MKLIDKLVSLNWKEWVGAGLICTIFSIAGVWAYDVWVKEPREAATRQREAQEEEKIRAAEATEAEKKRKADELEADTKRKREQEERDWDSIDNRLDRVFQFIKAKDTYSKKAVPKSNDRPEISKFVTQTQKSDHRAKWKKLLAGMPTLDASSPISDWRKRINKFEVIESTSHDDYSAWVVKFSVYKVASNMGARPFTAFLTQPIGQYGLTTAVCADCDEPAIPDFQARIQKGQKVIKGYIVDTLPKPLLPTYPVFDVSDPRVRESMGKALPLNGYFFPEPKHLEFSATASKANGRD